MKRISIFVFSLLSLVLCFSCLKESKSPTGPPLGDICTISGTVTGADSVTVTLSGSSSATWIVNNSSESYSFTVAPGNTYTVTPSKSGYTFTPSNKTIDNQATNITQNFEANIASYTLTGTVSGADSVIITLSGDASDTQTINSGETYSFTVPGGGTYTITPTTQRHSFTPANIKYENLSSNKNQNFDLKHSTYTFSGVIAGVDTVTVILSGDASATWAIKKSGDSYSFTVAIGGSYVITPFKGGYTFTPPNKTIDNLATNITQNFDAKITTYKIFGTVTGADSVLITLSGNSSGTWMVNNGESYSFTVAPFGTYTVTPSKKGYVFNPISMKFVNLVENKTLSCEAIPLYTLSGTIIGADGVKVDLSGDATGSQTVNDGGTYSFTVPKGSSYTITPSKQWYSLTPSNKKYENLSSNQVQDFDVKRNLFTISGTVTGADNVTVTLSGSASDSKIVNSGESYSFIENAGGTYTITPSKKKYVFTPPEKKITLSANLTQNFEAKRTYYTLSGTVTDADSVLMTLSGDSSATSMVNSGGTYSFTVDANGTFSVTPSKTGATFIPASKKFTNVTANMKQDFKLTPPWDKVGINKLLIPAGSFSMGQANKETPVHEVILSEFEISSYEITQAQYNTIFGFNPSNFTGDDNLPVENVSWWSAIVFCNTLSAKAGLSKCYDETSWACDFTKNGFRLPTEAEWEYACRAGTTTTFYLGNAESDMGRAGWYDSNSSSKTHPVGKKTPNAWGLYDMHGNLWEWCNDLYGGYSSAKQNNPIGAQSGAHRVIRGGGWDIGADFCTSAIRGHGSPDYRDSKIGFRVVRRP